MRILRDKSKVSTVALVLVLTITALMAGIPVVTAHDPPMSLPTYAYVTASPNPVGVAQDAIIYMWLNLVPPTATGPWGDRWEGFELEVTKPDGSTQDLGTFTSDPIGFAWTLYAPDETGNYTFHFRFPGQTLEGKNLMPGQWQGLEFIGDYFEESSAETTLTVQDEQLEPYPVAEPPADYWSRPIDAQHREWWSFSGNFLTSAMMVPVTCPYTEGPESAHILWAEPLTFGGLVGGEFGVHSYHCGNAYEGKWWPPVIIGGILYYNQFPSSMAYDEAMGMSSYYMPGVHAVDLRTGEEIWYNPDIRIDFGQIYYYDSMNQHGAAAYLWQQEGSTWICYDAWTGQWFYNITNMPPGIGGMFGAPFVFGPNGEILAPTIGPSWPPGQPLSWLAMWDNTAIPELTGAADIPGAPLNGTAGNMWRPYNKVVDGQHGWVWNVTLPPEVTRGSINHILLDEYGNPDRIIGSWMNSTGMFAVVAFGDLEVWCVSLKEGERGKLLWKTEIARPSGAGLNMGPASLEDGVFTVWCPETRQHWGFSVEDGDPLWGPTDPQPEWDMLVATGSGIYNGKLISCGMGGTVYCYDVQTGLVDWTYDLVSLYYLEAKWGGRYPHCTMRFADGKVYVFTGEHSPDDPKERGSPLVCIDIATGDDLWTIPFYASHWAQNPAIADGILVYLNIYDNRIYAFGKGQTATEISASPKIIANGASVLIEGQVTDQSPGAEGTPAIADEDMSEWMKYLYMQFPCPMDIHGVDVMLQAKSSNGTIMDLATVTSDGYGCFSYEWTPPYEDQYTIMAIFLGSKSYWASYAQTAVSVGPAPEAPPEPEEEPAYTTIDLAIIAAVVVAIVIGIVNLWALRKR